MQETIIRKLAADEFCRKLEEDIRAGKGLLPFVGAGLSARAGIPIRDELRKYLQLCVGKALGLFRIKNEQEPANQWHPRKGEWPEMEDEWRDDAAKCVETLDAVLKLRSREKSQIAESFLEVCAQAKGALTDWRLALQFLARIEIKEFREIAREADCQFEASNEDDPSNENKPKLRGRIEQMLLKLGVPAFGDVDPYVIDAFFNHLVSGRVPTMEHRMIAHLSNALRTRVILTLNFDDLIEQAFRDANLELAVFDVHQGAGLPPLGLLGKEHSLVKMHGGRYGLRADFTLDRLPTEDDRNHFCDYLVGREPAAGDSAGVDRIRKRGPKNVLFLAGISGLDRRVVSLVAHALARIPELVVYWYCHTQSDEETVRQNGKLQEALSEGDSSRLYIVQNEQLGLLFWEMYQQITRSLPPGGLDYPVPWILPVPPRFLLAERSFFEYSKAMKPGEVPLLPWEQEMVPDRMKARETASQEFAAIEMKFEDWRKAKTKNVFFICPPESAPPDHTTGITQLGWRLFETAKRQAIGIWIDSSDVRNVRELQERLLQAVASHRGRVHRRPPLAIRTNMRRRTIGEKAPPPYATAEMDKKEFREEMEEYLKGSGHSWILFANFREPFGYNSNRMSSRQAIERATEFPTGARNLDEWITIRAPLWEVPSEAEERGRSNDASILEFVEQIADELGESLQVVLLGRPDKAFIDFAKRSKAYVTHFACNFGEDQSWAEKRADKAVRWVCKAETIDGRNRRTRLLRALAIFQPARHQTALVTRAVLCLSGGKREWDAAWTVMEEDIAWLLANLIIRKRAGGFLWMHWKMREAILFKLLTDKDIGGVAFECSAELHLGLGDWCMSFFHATGDPLAVFQAIYHRCRVAHFSWDQGEFVRARGALTEAVNHLEAGRAGLITRGLPLDACMCFDGLMAALCALVENELRVRNDPMASEARWDEAERNLRFLLMVKVRAQLYQLWLYRDLGMVAETLEACEEVRTWRKRWNESWVPASQGWGTSARRLRRLILRFCPRGGDVWDDYYASFWPSEAHWHGWLLKMEESLAAFALRTYGEAENSLRILARDAGYDPTAIIDVTNSAEDVWSAVTTASKASGGLHRYEDRRIAVHVYRRIMELELLRAETQMALASIDPQQQKPIEKYLNKADRCYLAGNQLQRYVTEEEASRVGVEKSRLHSLRAGVLALRSDWQGVHRHLKEALVSLGNLTESEEAISRIVIDLRRAYCKFAELRTLENLGLFHRHTLHGVAGTAPRCFNEDELEVQEIPRAEALIEDIRRILEAVQRRMKRDRKSLWWWLTMCRYQLLLTEYRTLLRRWYVRAGSIERTDVESAKGETLIAIRLMKAACRRVVYDEFQLARIAQIALNLAGLGSEGLGTSEGAMGGVWKETLDTLLKRLMEVRESRASAAEFFCGLGNACGEENSRNSLWKLGMDEERYVDAIRMGLENKLVEIAEAPRR